ncbi:hypothetical protein BDM02DRAFT_1305127 [Thelephora ganbajun]|uniref:Uncharacterized protein n=1 Tax=Thelephora ganbajun TaxID=370292 RepID=A0ACB6ZMF0_THEGA|nr:hypothetical protein BDM02DRAFT_1305127 [Thelephora ganbajun]
MPKSKQKYYAVKVGRGGPQIYDTWEECLERVNRYPGNKYKSFRIRAEAEEWIKAPGSRPIPTVSKPSTSGKPPSSQVEEPPVMGESIVTLSPEQTHVLDMVKSRRNVFFTGSAGTGKSVLLRQIISWARKRRDTDAGVTASTGMAAVNIGGVTLHSWAGIGLGNGDLEKYVDTIKFGPGHWKNARERWRKVKTLIIDESNLRFLRSDTPADNMDSIYDRCRSIRQTSMYSPRDRFVLHPQPLQLGIHSSRGQRK